MSFSPGESVLVQEVWRDRVWAARPMTVVDDDGDFVALWFPRGTRWKRPIPPPAHPVVADRGIRLARCLARGEWVFEDAEWEVTTLTLMRAGDLHAVWVSWLQDGAQWGWYVNLQEPYRRTSVGFATMDLALDILIDNDRTWRWKDEDELATFVELGVIEDRTALRIREEGLSVVGRAERNEFPFDREWSSWRPDGSWGRPELPANWDVLCR